MRSVEFIIHPRQGSEIMPLRSSLLMGDPRLEKAAAGGPSVKSLPVVEPTEAVQRIQMALYSLSYVFFHSFSNNEPDGLFGPDTHAAVVDFQKANFKNQPDQWDGRVGAHTLGKLDSALRYVELGSDVAARSSFVPTRSPAGKPGPKPLPPAPKPRLESKRIAVDTDAQTLQAFVGNRLIYDWDCVTGDSGHPTDPGPHHVLNKILSLPEQNL